MFKYLDMIRKFHATYGGTSWLRYDEDFRRRAAQDPGLAWGDVDLQLWMKWMSPLKPPRSRQLPAEGDEQAPPPSPPLPPPPLPLLPPRPDEKSQLNWCNREHAQIC
ncbi:hypothetical protein Y1Q_0022483 [Alligator mississippiensis]|uniref:Leiomodin-2-like n=1 Tax=Alligator mississippiensis TaxID=8496 RepID=A0A151N0K6_ALLMI|nr:hypothetical protein Y1Q_0022483 [Alligator mississippiensis]